VNDSLNGQGHAPDEPKGPAPRTRVVLVDDHAMVRMSLKLLLRLADDIEVVGEAGDGEEALRVCAQTQPEVVLMDLRLPRLDGVATIRALQHHDPVPRVLVLTASYHERLIAEALAAGAAGYVLKDGVMDQLVAAIRAARDGRRDEREAAPEEKREGSAPAPASPTDPPGPQGAK
jgi:DNA-binding NarL/FixJ family response regulator